MSELSPVGSERISLLRFPLIVGVVLIHAPGIPVVESGGSNGVATDGPVSDFFKELIANGIARVAVPAFFLVSGFLLFHRTQWSASAYRRKLRARVRTLLIPFLIWNSLVITFFFVAQSVPGLQSFFSGSVPQVAGMRPVEVLDYLVGFTGHPASYPFWFIRDLMVLVVLAPAVHWLATRAGPVTAAVLVIAWVWPALWPRVPNEEAALFFFAGALLAVRRVDPFARIDSFGAPLLWLYAGVQLADAFTKDAAINPPLHKLAVALGVAAVLQLSERLRRSPLRSRTLDLAAAAFFVFAMHEPTLTVIRKAAFSVAPPSGDAMLLLYFLAAPAATIAIALAARSLLVRLAPRLLSLAEGGRTVPGRPAD